MFVRAEEVVEVLSDGAGGLTTDGLVTVNLEFETMKKHRNLGGELFLVFSSRMREIISLIWPAATVVWFILLCLDFLLPLILTM